MKSGEAAERWPSVSVIVVTKGHHADAEAAVASILRSPYPGSQLELIVVEETDVPTPIVGECVRYHAIPVRNLGVGYARNQGVLLACGDVVVFTDDDCIVDRDWLCEIVRPLVENADAEAVAGAVLVPPCGPVGVCENVLGFPGGGLLYLHGAGGKVVPMPTFSTCNCAVRRELRRVAFRFHEGFTYAGEDELLSREISASAPVLYNPAARVYHRPRDDFGGVFRWFVRRGQARVEMLRYSGFRRDMCTYAIFTSLVLRLLAVLVLCLLVNVPLAGALVVLFVLYYGTVLWRYRWALEHGVGWRALALVPFVKAAMDAGMDVGVIATFVRGAGLQGKT